MNQLQQKLSFEEEIQKLINRVDETKNTGKQLKTEILEIFVQVAEILLMFCDHNMIKMKPLRKKKSKGQVQSQDQQLKEKIQKDGSIDSIFKNNYKDQEIRKLSGKDLSDLFGSLIPVNSLTGTKNRNFQKKFTLGQIMNDLEN